MVILEISSSESVKSSTATVSVQLVKNYHVIVQHTRVFQGTHAHLLKQAETECVTDGQAEEEVHRQVAFIHKRFLLY